MPLSECRSFHPIVTFGIVFSFYEGFITNVVQWSPVISNRLGTREKVRNNAGLR